MFYSRTIFFSLIIIAVHHCPAMGQSNNFLWEKHFSKVIEVRESDSLSNNKKTFFDFIVDKVNAQQVNVYRSFQDEQTEVLTREALHNIMFPGPDTLSVVNAKTGTVEHKIVQKPFCCTSVDKYKVYEYWSFDPLTGEGKIQVTGIAPLITLFDGKGQPRAMAQAFFLPYSSFKMLSDQYNGTTKHNRYISAIWKGYGSGGITLWDSSGARYEKGVANAIDIDQTTFDPSSPTSDVSIDAIGKVIFDAIDSGSITAYPILDMSLTHGLNKEEVRKMIYPDHIDRTADTIDAEPDFNGPANINKYGVLECFTFNIDSGVSNFSIKAVSPIGDFYDKQGRRHTHTTMFWLKYRELVQVLIPYSEHNHTNTLQDKIWDGVFR